MPVADWKSFLQSWSDAILASGDFADELSPAAEADRWAGFAPASEAAIAAAEARLGRVLPALYKAFLAVSNGWWIDGTDGPIRLWGVEEIRPMAEVQPEIVEMWSSMGLTEEDVSERRVGVDGCA